MGKKLRSQLWFENPDDPEMTAIYLERYLNYGITRQELQSGKPIIGIAQTGSDIAPCNRHHLELAKRVRDGIIVQGGIPFEFPVHPIQETGKRPTAMLDRNLSYLSLVETLFGYPIDGVVLMIGCDKTTPSIVDGSIHGQHSCHRTVGWTDAEWLARRRAHRFRNHRLEGPVSFTPLAKSIWQASWIWSHRLHRPLGIATRWEPQQQ